LSTGTQPEQRRHRRLDLALPIRFSGRTATGAGYHGQGLTADISSGGVRFETDLAEPPPTSADVAIHITIPRHGDSAKSAVFLSGNARVLRCAPVDATTRRHTGARWLVAARFDAHPDISLPIVEDFAPGAS